MRAFVLLVAAVLFAPLSSGGSASPQAPTGDQLASPKLRIDWAGFRTLYDGQAGGHHRRPGSDVLRVGPHPRRAIDPARPDRAARGGAEEAQQADRPLLRLTVRTHERPCGVHAPAARPQRASPHRRVHEVVPEMDGKIERGKVDATTAAVTLAGFMGHHRGAESTENKVFLLLTLEKSPLSDYPGSASDPLLVPPYHPRQPWLGALDP